MAEQRKPKAFISSSLRKEDEAFAGFVTRITAKMGFLPVGPVGKCQRSQRIVRI